MNNWLILPLVVLMSFVLTELIRRYTVIHNLMDVPNARSSHTIPTPRGGGLSIVVIFLVSILQPFVCYVGIYLRCSDRAMP